MLHGKKKEKRKKKEKKNIWCWVQESWQQIICIFCQMTDCGWSGCLQYPLGSVQTRHKALSMHFGLPYTHKHHLKLLPGWRWSETLVSVFTYGCAETEILGKPNPCLSLYVASLAHAILEYLHFNIGRVDAILFISGKRQTYSKNTMMEKRDKKGCLQCWLLN